MSTVSERELGNRPRRQGLARRIAGRKLKIFVSVLVIVGMVFAPILSIVLNQNGALSGSGGSDGTTIEVTPTAATATTSNGPFSLNTASSNLTVVQKTGLITVYAQTYSLTVDYRTGGYVTYKIQPYFTTDYIVYRRVNPAGPGDGTVDQYNKAMDYVTMTISKWGRSGSTVWFLESCSQFSLTQSFTFYKDYMELDTTYAPGTSKVMTTYFVGEYSAKGSMYNLYSDGKNHRYVPGYPENWPKANGLGGWYPSYLMYAPAMDVRVPGRQLGVEWGFSDTEAYISSPVWTKDMGGGGESFIALKYTSLDCKVPSIASGAQETFHQFIRPYKYTDGLAQGHAEGYAQWVSAKIVKTWGSHSTDIFPLTFGNMNTWDSTIRSYVEGSQITVAMQSKNADQINWNYKSAQQMTPTSKAVPSAWALYDSAGHPYKNTNGYYVASAASSAYRNYLINQDDYNSWWWGSTGVFFDQCDSINGYNQLLSDYNTKPMFVYDGFLNLAKEARASGHWSYVIMNSYTAQLHLSMVCDLTLVEGWKAVPSYNTDFRSHVISTMLFVNNIPDQYRPHIVVYQNYVAGSDQAAVYSAVFGAARYGFCVELLSYSSFSSQIHNLQMAENMFKAMGASRHQDPTITPATLDTASEGTSLTTNKQMIVVTGSGSPVIKETGVYSKYMLTNLWSATKSFTLTLPAGSYAASGGITISSTVKNSDGTVKLTGTIIKEATGTITKK